MTDLQPHELNRRSPVYRRLAEAGARFSEMNGAAVAVVFTADLDAAAELARNSALADLSPLPRLGVEGPGAATWLRKQGLTIGEEFHRSLPQTSGELAIRLSDYEVLILGDLRAQGDVCHRLLSKAEAATHAGTYLIPRADSHCWFSLVGQTSPDCLAKLCGLDLRRHKFEDGTAARTFVAGISATVVRADLGTTPCLYLLADSSYAEYLWSCLTDAMSEYDGGLIGLETMVHLLDENR